MTTIAADARLGQMASDSHWSTDSEVGPVRKVWRYHGRLCGFSGTMSETEQVRAWFRSNCKTPPPKVTDVAVLVLSAAGLQTWTPGDGFLDMPDTFAIGTGGPVARAVLMLGHTPSKAVQVAKMIDAKTSGKVRVYHLHP